MEYIILEAKKAQSLRDRFINTYIDKTSEHYRTYIAAPSRFETGPYYDGYLWDCLKNNQEWRHLCPMDAALAEVFNKKSLFVMWDLFSSKRVHIERQLCNSYPKDTMIEVRSELLAPQLRAEWEAEWSAEGLWLPEDIYCFDESMSWCVIFTHETLEDDSRVCFIASPSTE